MTLRDRIRELANKRGMSLPNLESELGFGNGTIVRWDKASPTSEKLSKVADYFNVTIDYLLGREEKKENDFPELEGVYLSYAKEAQDNGIDPEDIKLAIETIKRLRGV